MEKKGLRGLLTSRIREWLPGGKKELSESMNREVYIIVGLGNPGSQYAHTRHNAGFDTMDYLAGHFQTTLGRKTLQGILAETAEGQKKIVLCEPQTFMNNSGQCVAALLSWYKCPPDHLLVIYDDIDLPPGRIRVRKNGGPGTHNGMRSIAEQLGHTDFPRIRIGTGNPPEGGDLVSWVLGHYDPETRKAMEKAFRKAAETAADWVENGIDHAMQLGNRKE